MDQKQIKEKYMEIIRTEVWPNSPHMQTFEEKQFYYGVELANGDIYVIEKPSIKKDFCFGYGMYGADLNNDQKRADAVAQKVRESQEYFIKENLSEINQKIEMLMSSHHVAYKYLNYTGQQSGSKLKAYTVCHLCDGPEYNPVRWTNLIDVERLTDEEINALIDGYGVVKGMFTKRLNTYLKRYGLTKLNVWTYLRD